MSLQDKEIEKQSWSKELKKRVKDAIPDMDFDDFKAIIALINWAIEEKEQEMQDTVKDWACSDCDERMGEPMYNEGYD